ncbi:MAG: TIGR00730 family Rossman fold protein [Candidatus Omnitrophica bacterium]|nr:TIGR00730 family Rossman fold protein [Candidatus Omnitrophota bacterium]
MKNERWPVQDITSTEDPWRVFRIMSEFVEGFDMLSRVGKAVTIFGSARLKPSHKMYKLAEKTAYLLGKEGYAIITGGGPGIMEAANKGARESGAESVGLNIELPFEQVPNKHITFLIDFHYFFCRKFMFLKYAKAFVIFPGGFGTLDEFFESVTLVQTKRMARFPVILVGKEYWKGMMDWIHKTMMTHRCIDHDDLNIFQVVDTPAEVVKIICDFYAKEQEIINAKKS